MFHHFLDWLASSAVRSTAFFIQRLPLSPTLKLGRGLGFFGYLLVRKRARLAYANLKCAFPESTPQQRGEWVREMFCQLGMNGIEILRFPTLTKEHVEDHVCDAGYETYLEHRWKEKGAILLTAHFGNWEYSQIVEGIRGRPITILARRQKYERLDTFLNSLRQRYGSISVGKGGGVREVIRSLREGKCVGMLADQSGGDEGIWVRFFGRLTTAPRGPMGLALRLGATVLPVFFIRRGGPDHELHFEPPMELTRTGDDDKDVEINTQRYIRLLESYLRKYPTQWLWGHKRWKRTRTKRILILSDGKPGHVKQSEALAREIVQSVQQKTPPYEISIERSEIEFRSPWRRRLFYGLAPLFIPWAQGRLQRLNFFLTAASLNKISMATPDLIISAGAALVPLNLCLSNENCAKSAVVMKPSFPFNLFRYDLALIPAHDSGLMPGGNFRIQGVLSGMESDELKASGKILARSLRHPEKIRFSLFVGGETRHFKLPPTDIENLLEQLNQSAESLDGDFLVTTSRRTPPGIVEKLRSELSAHPRCQLVCVATEDPRPEVVPGMMSLAETLIVTEDSLSMISEALRSSKRVIVVKMNSNGLPRKHTRFQENLKKNWGVPVVEAAHLSEALEKKEPSWAGERWQEEQVRLREKVGDLL